MYFFIISAVVRINTYSWGSNSNVTLGHEMSRQYPEKLKMLTHHSTKQVSICYHYRNGSFIHRIDISRMKILVNIRDFIFTNLLAS